MLSYSPPACCRPRAETIRCRLSTRYSLDFCAVNRSMKNNISLHLFIGASVAVAACGTPARLPVSAGTGVRPVLRTPEHALIPIVNVVTAKPWQAEATPRAADGLTVHAFARGLDHPRWLYVLPNGDVLVAETNAPRRPEDGKE